MEMLDRILAQGHIFSAAGSLFGSAMNCTGEKFESETGEEFGGFSECAIVHVWN